MSLLKVAGVVELGFSIDRCFSIKNFLYQISACITRAEFDDFQCCLSVVGTPKFLCRKVVYKE